MKRLIVGLIFVAALGLAVFRLTSQGSSNKEHYELSEEISQLTIKDKNNKIELVAVDDDEAYVHIRYNENSSQKYRIRQSGDSLVMERKSTPFAFVLSWFNWGDLDSAVTVEISQKALAEIKLTTTNGSISVENLETEAAELETTNGKINIHDSHFTDELNCDTTNGKIEFANSSVNVGTLETTNGKIELFEVDVLDSLDIETTNATIQGTIVGRAKDFDISANTTNGSNSLADYEGGGSKDLSVETTNGSIKLDFTKE